jgi:outer membrane protein OmpA-like peptidoglycan-associated protein
MRYGSTSLFGAALLAGLASLPVSNAFAASAACSGTALTELRMSECLSPATRGIRPATQSAPRASPGTATPPPAAQPARIPAQSSPGVDLEIKFPFGSAELSPDAKALLQKLARVLASGDLASRSIKVIGHTDAAGGEELNQSLSTARAQAVSAYLAEQGVSGQRLIPSGVGKSDHKNPKDPLAAENRRVEIVPAG